MQDLTVGEGDDLAGTLGLRHSPDILYRVGLALAGLSTEMVGEIAITPDIWAVGSDPLGAGARVMDVGVGDGGEDELDGVEVGLHQGEASERGGEESHVEGQRIRGGRIYIFYLLEL